MKVIEILGIPFHTFTVEETLDTLESYLDTDKNHIVVTPNPEGVMQARRNPDLAHAIKSADLSLADGTGIVLAAKFKRLKIPGRVRGVDITFALLERLSRRGGTVCILGGKPGVAESAGINIEDSYPGVEVVGCMHGYFTDDAEIIAEINAIKPDLLLVGLGMPRQELWATKNIDMNTRITMCVGGTIDILAGMVQLAPPLLRKLGLEWLHRLIKQPSRFKRQLDIPRFIFAVLFGRK